MSVPTHPGGAGARPDHDGPALIFVGDGDTRNTPAEVIEARYPIRVERHALLPSAGGGGRRRGGPGVARDFRILEPGVQMQYTVENTFDPLAKGLEGGEDGRPGVVVNSGTDRGERPDRPGHGLRALEVGDVLSARSGGGAGYGRESRVGDGCG